MSDEAEKLRFEILLSFNYIDTLEDEISIADSDIRIIDTHMGDNVTMGSLSIELLNRNNIAHIKRCYLSELYPGILEYTTMSGEDGLINNIMELSTKAYKYGKKGVELTVDAINDSADMAKTGYDNIEYILEEKRSILHLLKNTLNSARISVIGKIRKYSQEIEFSLRGVDYQIISIMDNIKNLYISYPNDKISNYISTDKLERVKLTSKSFRFIYGDDKSLVNIGNDKIIKTMALAKTEASDGFMRFIHDEHMSKVGGKIDSLIDSEAFAKLPLFYGEPVIKELLKDRRTNIHIIEISGKEVTFFMAGHIRMSDEQRVRKIFSVKVPDYRDSWEPVIGNTGELLELLTRSLTIVKNFNTVIHNSYSLINDMEQRFEALDKAAAEVSSGELRIQAKNAEKAFNVSAYVAFKRVDTVYEDIKDAIVISKITIEAARASNEK